MSIQSSATACTITLFTAATYYLGRKTTLPRNALLTQCSGIAIASIINSVRPFSEPYLQKWFQEHQLDYIHGAASILLIGFAGCYAKIPLKTNATATLFFTALQIGVHKFSTHLFRDQLEAENHERTRNYYRRTSTFQNANYLRTELFPRNEGYSYREEGNSTAYLYVLPDGFFVFLADNHGLPFFPDRLGSIDATEVCKLQEEYCHSLKLSSEAIERLKFLAKQVTFDGTPQEWELQRIPPFICIEGKWNEKRNMFGKSVNWEELITRELTHQHEAFMLKLLPATWTTKPETPGLRGFNFNHSRARFNIWVHERNIRALKSEQESLVKEIEDFQKLITFIRDFETASFTFLSAGSLPTDRRGGIDWKTLQEWGNLTCRIPFPHLTTRYSNLAEKVRAFRRSQSGEAKLELLDNFGEFFRTLPLEAHFATDTVLAEQFQESLQAFLTSGNDLVRNRGYIDVRALGSWAALLRRTAYCLGSSPEINTLIANSQEYLELNNQLRRRPSNPKPLQQRRTELDPILKAGYNKFFQDYERVMGDKGEFVRDLELEINSRQKKQMQLQALCLCEQGLGTFAVGEYLKEEEGNLKRMPLEEWTKILELNRYTSDAQYQELVQNCRIYLRDHARSGRTPEKTALIDNIVAGYVWFFRTYMTGLEAANKSDFLMQIAKHTKCPRSHIDSTAQIAYYSYLESFHLHAIIRRNHAYQIGQLTSSIQSHLNDPRNDTDLPADFCTRFTKVCDRVSAFMVRKAQNLKTLQNDWVFSEEGISKLQHIAKLSEGSEYQFDSFEGTNAKDASRLFNNITQALSSLHTFVNQADETAYLASPFLEEEAGIITELYALATEMAFQLKVPMRWNLHRQLHEHSVQTSKAKKALAEEQNYSIYKRIGDGGIVLWDIVRNNEKSKLEKQDAVHTAIYCHRS